MFKIEQRTEVEDRRSPSVFVAKKVCIGTVLPNNIGKENRRAGMQKKKSVTFNDKMLVERYEYEDDDESRLGRMLYWEFMAADRVRFRDRIERMEVVLSPVLAASHRNIVYTRRILTSSEINPFVSSTVQLDNVAVVVVSKSKTETSLVTDLNIVEG